MDFTTTHFVLATILILVIGIPLNMWMHRRVRTEHDQLHAIMARRAKLAQELEQLRKKHNH